MKPKKIVSLTFDVFLFLVFDYYIRVDQNCVGHYCFDHLNLVIRFWYNSSFRCMSLCRYCCDRCLNYRDHLHMTVNRNLGMIAVNLTNVANCVMIHVGRFVDWMDEVAVVDVDYFVAMTVVPDYYDYLDSLQNNVHALDYRNQIHLCWWIRHQTRASCHAVTCRVVQFNFIPFKLHSK